VALSSKLGKAELLCATITISACFLVESLVAQPGDMINSLAVITDRYSPVTQKQREKLLKNAVLGDARAAYDLANYYARVDNSLGHEKLCEFFNSLGKECESRKVHYNAN